MIQFFFFLFFFFFFFFFFEMVNNTFSLLKDSPEIFMFVCILKK